MWTIVRRSDMATLINNLKQYISEKNNFESYKSIETLIKERDFWKEKFIDSEKQLSELKENINILKSQQNDK